MLQVAYSYTYELRPYLDLLLQMLLLEDSWQNHRIHNALKGTDIANKFIGSPLYKDNLKLG